jgi:hypothetical protein
MRFSLSSRDERDSRAVAQRSGFSFLLAYAMKIKAGAKGDRDQV